MKLVFCGTPEFAVPTLDALVGAGHEVALVLAQPDRAAGRGLEVQPGAVKAAALRSGLDLLQPEKIRNNEPLRTQLEQIAPDSIVVVAYGRIIPDWMLALPRLGCINLHGSLLPKYRGAAPIQWAVANGERETGVTTMLLEAGLDTGPILLAERVPIAGGEMAADLFLKLSEIGASLMVTTLARLSDGSITPQPQNPSLASLAPILTREEGRIDFSRTAQQIFDRWRGFYPWPGAFTSLRGKKLIIHRMSLSHGEAPAGELRVQAHKLLVGCGSDTMLSLDEVQMEGKKRMDAGEFLRGHQIASWERVGA